MNEEILKLKQNISDCVRDIRLLEAMVTKRKLEKDELEQELSIKLDTIISFTKEG